jgi:hypothetical protein
MVFACWMCKTKICEKYVDGTLYLNNESCSLSLGLFTLVIIC